MTELKYPKQVAFVKQANISHGHQQVNNGSNTNDAHAKEITNQSNELLEVNNGSHGIAAQALKQPKVKPYHHEMLLKAVLRGS